MSSLNRDGSIRTKRKGRRSTARMKIKRAFTLGLITEADRERDLSRLATADDAVVEEIIADYSGRRVIPPNRPG